MERDVPYIAYEGVIARFERITKRLTIALIVCIILAFASNAAWLWFFNQYEYAAEETVTVDGEEGNANYNYIKNGGVIRNGEDNRETGTAQDDEEKER